MLKNSNKQKTFSDIQKKKTNYLKMKKDKNDSIFLNENIASQKIEQHL